LNKLKKDLGARKDVFVETVARIVEKLLSWTSAG